MANNNSTRERELIFLACLPDDCTLLLYVLRRLLSIVLCTAVFLKLVTYDPASLNSLMNII